MGVQSLGDMSSKTLILFFIDALPSIIIIIISIQSRLLVQPPLHQLQCIPRNEFRWYRIICFRTQYTLSIHPSVHKQLLSSESFSWHRLHLRKAHFLSFACFHRQSLSCFTSSPILIKVNDYPEFLFFSYRIAYIFIHDFFLFAKCFLRPPHLW